MDIRIPQFDSVRVLVAGAGALGSTLALVLQREGARVTLVDPAGVGDNASGVAAGMLAPAFEATLDPASEGHFGLLAQARGLYEEAEPLLRSALAAAPPGTPAAERAEDFVALEDWLTDGIPLVANVARECLVGWYGANEPTRGLWRIAARPVDPAAARCPALVVVPAHDRIVPPESAESVVSALPCSRHSTGRPMAQKRHLPHM